ncbi:tetratricopeptide repeat protein [Hyphomicrobium sp. CS1BSMeth3]|uniref:tetratricopeptide repeat protein n=1 Tax=Hyphomicrobium sp. CS1BSMeth3 TaxID=1892844 RepID=UPI001575B32F|nr:tetratricopeptide repeat protein [Hyphomicrobium sp. CS1BSMeth3]
MSAELTSRRAKAWASAAALALAVLLAPPGAGPTAAKDAGVTFVSPDAALEQGINAYRGGYVEFAIPALRFAANSGEFLAQYLLAAILSDNAGAHTDHGEAFRLLRQIVVNNANIDPDDDPRAPYVSKALLSFGEYLNRGVPELKMPANPAMALRYIEHAAKFFGNRDAQFVLAKMLISGEGGRKDPALALHFLSTLVQGGHAGAQAFLADQYWRGTIVTKDETRALALAELAAKGAAPTDYLWIDEIYQNIYCGMNEPRRNEARPLVQRWGQFFGFGGRASRKLDQDQAEIGFVPTRTCADGKPVPLLEELRGPGNLQMPAEGALTASPAQPRADPNGVRDVGARGR